jgi:hypothetical protein
VIPARRLYLPETGKIPGRRHELHARTDEVVPDPYSLTHHADAGPGASRVRVQDEGERNMLTLLAEKLPELERLAVPSPPAPWEIRLMRLSPPAREER